MMYMYMYTYMYVCMYIYIYIYIYIHTYKYYAEGPQTQNRRLRILPGGSRCTLEFHPLRLGICLRQTTEIYMMSLPG